jgi:hypothetical protein
VIVAITHSMSRDLYKQLVEAKMRGVMVYEMPTFYERVLGKIPVRHVSDLWFIYVPISGVHSSAMLGSSRRNVKSDNVRFITRVSRIKFLLFVR